MNFLNSSLLPGLILLAGLPLLIHLLNLQFPRLFEFSSIKHIRDHSNYLIPNGLLDVLDSIAIYLRCLLANIVIVLPLILALSVFTILCSPSEDALREPKFYNYVAKQLFGGKIPEFMEFKSFGFTILLFVIVFVC